MMRVGEAAQQHDQRHDDVHHAELLVVDRGEPLAPQVAPLLEVGDQTQHRRTTDGDARGRDHDDRLVERNRVQTELTEHALPLALRAADWRPSCCRGLAVVVSGDDVVETASDRRSRNSWTGSFSARRGEPVVAVHAEVARRCASPSQPRRRTRRRDVAMARNFMSEKPAPLKLADSAVVVAGCVGDQVQPASACRPSRRSGRPVAG